MFEKLLDKATSPLLLEPDWQSILKLCDIIKSQEISGKLAIQTIKKKFRHENAHVILNSLQCLESIVKNCGGSIHREIAQKDTLESLRELAKNGPDPIRNKVLELIQCWSYGLGERYKILTDTYNLMKLENYRFPKLKESEAMFQNDDIPPEWRDDKECFRCRQTFTTFIRKHHCRACGDIFCDKCSSKSCPIPKFGIDHDVRVCDSCYEKLTNRVQPIIKSSRHKTKNKKQTEIDEDESLQLALAISKSEADEKERQKKILAQKYATSTSTNDNEESKEINEPLENEPKEISNENSNFISEKEIDEYTSSVLDHINNFKFRMLSDQQRNRNITNDTAVQSIFVMLQHLHPQLNHFIQLLDEKRTYYESLQDKLTQLKDAREALNALRAENLERKRQDAFERERQRQIQLAQKLDFMRQKKQEYLDYQRQMHLQQLAQQEFEMKARLEQQRQLASAREQNSHFSMMPYDYGPFVQQQQQQQPYYTSMMTYPTNIDQQMQLTNATLSYVPQQQPPIITTEKPDTQLIIFD